VVILSACGQPQQRRRLQQPRFERLLLVCHGELGYQRLVSQPQHGQLAEQPEQHQQDKRLLRPLPSELTLFQWNADNADGYDKIWFNYQRSSFKSASSAFYYYFWAIVKKINFLKRVFI